MRVHPLVAVPEERQRARGTEEQLSRPRPVRHHRIDDEALIPELDAVCRMWSAYCNLFRLGVGLVEKVREQGRRGTRKKYNAPMTPARRLIRSGALPEEKARSLTETAALTNSLGLYADIERRLARVYRRMSVKTKRGGLDSDGIPSPSAPPLLRKQQLMVSTN